MHFSLDKKPIGLYIYHMRNPEKTKSEIIKAAAELFNRRGYTGCSISSIMDETGFKKGGIYNHFSGKEEIAVAAFDFSFKTSSEMIYRETEKGTDPLDKIHRMFDAFGKLATNPPVPGGCPVMNTAIDSDDRNPELLEKSRRAMDIWRRFTENLLNEAKTSGAISETVDTEQITTFMISSLEGGIMMTKMYKNAEPLDAVISNLKTILRKP